MNSEMPLHPGRAARDLRQHQVDDVLGQLVVAAGDPHLVAEEPVGAVVGCGSARVVMSASDEPACGSDRHIVPKNRPSSIGRTYVSTCSSVPCASSRFALRDGQERVGRGADVRRLEPGEARRLDDLRQLQPADPLVHRRRRAGPALGERVQRDLHLRGMLHPAVDELGLVRRR